VPADPVLLRSEAYDSPAAQRLIEALQQEYVVRYGGTDETPVDPAEFTAPEGYFVVAWLGEEPVACGGWRAHGPQTAEVKRMYVRDGARRRGIARLILGDLERSATAAGFARLILETGDQQPESLALYAAAGFQPVEPFGLYKDSPGSRYFGKLLKRL
jgi:GNAT superfamily N-acetyltransferase